jgi:hypothetical protein
MKSHLDIPLVQRLISQVRHTVPIDSVRTPFGEPFNRDNHWVRTLAEYSQGLTDFRESSLHTFHKNFKPATILDVVEGVGSNLAGAPPLGSYPWGKWTSRSGMLQWEKSCHCGPSSDELIEKEWNDFVSLFEKIKSEGFDYRNHGHPLGLFFVSSSNQKLFIVLGGNHRTAIAKALGIETLRVRLLPRRYLTSQIIRYSKISNDPLSKIVFNNIVSENFIDWRGGANE